MKQPKRLQPKRDVNVWETVSFKVLPEMKKKIEADMVMSDCPNEAEYFRFLLRERFQRAR
jgi:hypothetical protein